MSVANRREESAAATRQLLLDEAARLFSQQGFAKTSLSEIVANVGATKGALYHHWKSKEDLALSLIEAVGEDYNIYLMTRIDETFELVVGPEEEEL